MNKEEVERHAKALMTAHGVGYMTFKWKRSKRGIASCHYYKTWNDAGRIVCVPNEIRFSELWLPHLSPEKIHEVMLHEIAHAKAPGDGHGHLWAAECHKLGIPAKRCQDSLPSAPEGKVSAYCPVCESGRGTQHRLPLRVKWCGVCCKARRTKVGTPGTALKWFKEGKRVYNRDMPARYRAEFERILEREASNA